MVNPADIERIIARKGVAKNNRDLVGNMYYNLMVNCNQSYCDINKMPIPMAMELLKKVDRQAKEIEKKNGRR